MYIYSNDALLFQNKEIKYFLDPLKKAQGYEQSRLAVKTRTVPACCAQ